MDDEFAREERLKLVQDVRVYPVGRVLRDTFDADNHETLGNDVAGLMINLSRVPYEPSSVPAKNAVSGQRKGVFARLGALLRRH